MTTHLVPVLPIAQLKKYKIALTLSGVTVLMTGLALGVFSYLLYNLYQLDKSSTTYTQDVASISMIKYLLLGAGLMLLATILAVIATTISSETVITQFFLISLIGLICVGIMCLIIWNYFGVHYIHSVELPVIAPATPQPAASN